MLETIQNTDLQILLLIQEYIRTDFLTPVMRFASFLGNAGWFWLVLCAFLILLPSLPFAQKKLPYRKAGLTALLSLAIGFLITNLLLKNTVARIRPYDLSAELIPLVTRPSDFSFPSGHTTASFAAALVLVRLLPKKTGIPLVVLAALIAISRLYVGVHYPTDVLAGFLIGLAASLLAPWITNRFARTGRQKPRRRRRLTSAP